MILNTAPSARPLACLYLVLDSVQQKSLEYSVFCCFCRTLLHEYFPGKKTKVVKLPGMILSQQGKGNFNAPPWVACRKIMILQKLPAINGASCLQNNSRIVPATNKLVLCLSAFFTRNMQVVRVRSSRTT